MSKFITNHKYIIAHDLLCEMTTKQYLANLLSCVALIGLYFPRMRRLCPWSWSPHSSDLQSFSTDFPLSSAITSLKWFLVQTVRSSPQIFKHKTKLKMLLPGTVTQGLFSIKSHRWTWISGQLCITGVAAAGELCGISVFSMATFAPHPGSSAAISIEWIQFSEKQSEKLQSMLCIFPLLACLCISSFDG